MDEETLRARSVQRARWMERVQRGDREAYDELLTDMAPPLLRFLRRRIADAHELEGVFQDTLMAVHRARHTYDPSRRGAAGAWHGCRSEESVPRGGPRSTAAGTAGSLRDAAARRDVRGDRGSARRDHDRRAQGARPPGVQGIEDLSRWLTRRAPSRRPARGPCSLGCWTRPLRCAASGHPWPARGSRWSSLRRSAE